MTKELEVGAIDGQRMAATQQRKLRDVEANPNAMAFELPTMPLLDTAPLGLGLLDSAGVEDQQPPAIQLLHAEPSRSPLGTLAAASGSEEEGLKIAFYDEHEALPAVPNVASTVVLAQVVGDELLAYRSRSTEGKKSPYPTSKHAPDVVVEMMPGEDSQVAALKLRHPELGRILAKVDLRGSRIAVRIESLSAHAARAFRGAEPALREALSKHGIALSELHLVTNSNQRSQRASNQHVLDEEA